jgi:hypothetical protein
MAAARSPVLAFCALLACSTAAIPQELTVGDLKDPQKITGDELRQVLTGAKITSKTRHGSTRHWTNNADGKFTASTDSRGFQGAPTAYQTTGAGSWHVSANDQYCVYIDWRRVDEKWCVFILKADGKYYGAARPNDPSSRAVDFGLRTQP